MKYILGIDIGSVSICAALISPDSTVVQHAYVFHNGAVAQQLEAILEEFPLSDIGAVAATSSTPELVQADTRYDSQVALITSVKYTHEEVQGILFVGGENFGLIRFDSSGQYAGGVHPGG